MQDERWPAHGHAIGDALDIRPVHVELTPADHPWQNESPGASDRVFQPEDACGFWIETPDGTVWAPGDSRLIPDHDLQMPALEPVLPGADARPQAGPLFEREAGSAGACVPPCPVPGDVRQFCAR